MVFPLGRWLSRMRPSASKSATATTVTIGNPVGGLGAESEMQPSSPTVGREENLGSVIGIDIYVAAG